MASTPWSLRDSPVSLAVATIGLIVVILVLGFITVRTGNIWIKSYIQHHAISP